MRKQRLAECDPRWGVDRSGKRVAVTFDCPEADGGCGGRHAVPLDRWTVVGEMPDITLDPSVACSGACQMHINITNGAIKYALDSKSGPDWSKVGA